jgi:site-specific recombinase XerD
LFLSDEPATLADPPPFSCAFDRALTRPHFSSDNPIPAFLAFLAEDTKVGERTARQYLAHLQRLAAWLEQHYQAALLEATTRDLRQYRLSSARVKGRPRSTPR